MLSTVSKEEVLSSLYWGFVCGLGVAVKLTFLPILIIPLIVLSWKNKGLFICVFAASFFVWTLPILSKYPRLWGWITGIVTHTGTHGSGDAGVIEIHSYCLSWKNIILQQWVFVSFAFAALALAVWKLIDRKWDKGTFFLVVTVAGAFFQFSVVAKHPGAHYLLPGLGLFSVILALLYLQWPLHNILAKRVVIAFISIFILLGAWQANKYRLNLASFTKDLLSFNEHIRSKYQDCIIIDYYQSSGQASALVFL